MSRTPPERDLVSITDAARQTGLADADVVALTVNGRVHYEGFRGRLYVDLGDVKAAANYLDIKPPSPRREPAERPYWQA